MLGLVLGWQEMGVLWPSPGSERSHSVRPGTGMARDGGSLAFPGFREISQCQAWYWDGKGWGFSGLPGVQEALTVLGLVLG